LKSPTVSAACIVFAASAGWAAPALADVIPGTPDLLTPETWPVVIVAAVFVLVVSGVSFVLLRRMARKRAAADVAPAVAAVPTLPAPPAPEAGASEADHEV